MVSSISEDVFVCKEDDLCVEGEREGDYEVSKDEVVRVVVVGV